jgi:anthranilate synthase component 1
MSGTDAASVRAALAAGRGGILVRERVADLDTPVGAFLKLTGGAQANAFLLESIEGGAARGRYSGIGLAPDLVWRCRDGRAEINRHALTAPHAFVDEPGAALDSLRRTINEARMPVPPGLPPMAAGLFGYLGYDMVRLIERLPSTNPDVLGIPDAVLTRPTLMAVFDHVRDTLTLCAPVWPGGEPDALIEAAEARLDEAEAALDRPVPPNPTATSPRPATSPPSSAPRNTSAPAMPSRWCPPSVSRCPSRYHPSRCIARCGGSTRRPSWCSGISAGSRWWPPAPRSWCAAATTP